MCYHPITIINPCKYVSLRYRERYLLQVPCGHCAQCATNKANEWYFRSYHQALDTLASGNPNSWILFDTLTYRNADLPHISDFVSVPDGCDFPCFNSSHIQLFLKRLRKKTSKHGSKFSFFLTSEYGTSERHTHRPHYHILFYCKDGNIDPLLFSKYVSDCWSYGRTDGIPYKPGYYVRNNIFTSERFDHSLRTCRYISKYIQKSYKFEKEINKRLDRIMLSISDRMIDGWLDSVHAKRVRMRYARLVNQFHRQSIGFGSSYLQDLDVCDFSSLDNVFMPDSKKVHLNIPLPMYFKRKMFYDVLKIDGNDTWILNNLGVQFNKYRDNIMMSNLVDRFKAANHQAGVKFDSYKLADYVLHYRGRIVSVELPSDPLYKYNNPSFFSYSTMSDKEKLENLGLSRHFVGNNTIGYRTSKLYNRIKFKDFIGRYVIINGDYEKQLEILYNGYLRINDGRQSAFELRQHLVNLYHHIGLV